MRQLPAGSRTVQTIEPRAQWDESAYLLALIADNLTFMRYENAGCKGPRPEPVPRPKGREPERAHRHLDVDDGLIDELLFGKRE